MIFTLENEVNRVYQNAKLSTAEGTIKSLLLGWQYSDQPTKLDGMKRGNKLYEALNLIDYFGKMKSANTAQRVELTKQLLDAQSGKEYSKLTEELFEGWITDEYAHIGGESDLNIYKKAQVKIENQNQCCD